MASLCDDNDSNNSKKEERVPTLYPVVLESSDTTLSLDGESLDSEGEEWANELAVRNNVLVPQTSTINIENSSDVVIGPLTQFHGPVTIFQNINSDSNSQPNLGVECKSDIILNSSAKLVAQDSDSSEHRHIIFKLLKTTPYKKLLTCAVVILALLTTVIVSIVFSLNLASKTDDYSADEDSTEDPPLGTHKMYSRKVWGGKPPLAIRPLRHPTEYVIISHTAGQLCHSLKECAPIMQQIQGYHVSHIKSPDIGYNFLIGGDGNIYIGRGWDAINFHNVNNIGICFMGDFVYDYLTRSMLSALKELLDLGIELNKLPPDYKLVCHNQTYNTLSPGDHVYEEVAKFPNFYTGPIKFHD